jgi:fatty-acyl-CoA synthase
MQLPLTPIRCLLRAVDLYPQKIGVVSGDNRYTYAEFAERCRRMAAGLSGAGVTSGDRVALLSFNTNVLLESYFAAPLAGAIVMPINVRLHTAEVKRLVEHAQPRVLFYEKDFSTIIDNLRTAAPECLFVSIDEDASPGDRTLASFLSADPVPFPDLASIEESAIAEIFYTSGSTGKPKGVMLSHRTLYLHALSLAANLDHSDRQVVLHTIPLFHANGWGFPQFATMYGLEQVMVRRFDPLGVFRLIERERATMMILVPTMAAALIGCPEREQFDLTSLEQIIIGGAASSPQLIAQLERAFPTPSVIAGYGLTETAPVIGTSRPKGTVAFSDEAHRLKFSSTAGWPFSGVEIRVVDEHGMDVPQDGATLGEVIVRGDNVMDGYYREPLMTSEVIVDGWFHTGDMAVWDQERCIDVRDRKKDIIISGGENIASIDVEQAIMAHPAVAECAVVAAPNERWGEVPVAIVVPKDGTSPTTEELLVFAATRLAKFKMPQKVIFRQEPLPKNGTGKVMKYVLREPLWAGIEKRVKG